MSIDKINCYSTLKERGSKFVPLVESTFTIACDMPPYILRVFPNYTKQGIDHSIAVCNSLKGQAGEFVKDFVPSFFDSKDITKFLYDLYSDGENEKELEELEEMLAELMGSLTDDHTDCFTCVVQSLVQP